MRNLQNKFLRLLSTFSKIELLVGGISVFLLVVFFYNYLNNRENGNQVVSKPLIKNFIKQPIQPKEKFQLSTPVETNFFNQNSGLKSPIFYKENDSLCLNIKDNIFFLPRQFAPAITKDRNYIFFLPTEYSMCLKPGNIKFWVIEYDTHSQFPYRFYFEMEAIINEVNKYKESDDHENNAFIETKLNILNTVFPHINLKSISRFRISEPTVTKKNFTLNNSFVLLGTVLKEDPGSNGILVDDKNIPNSLARDTYVSPTNFHMLEKTNAWTESSNVFISDSSSDLNILNLEIAYFFKFKKRPFLYFRNKKLKKLNSSLKEIHANFILNANSNYLFVDLRPLKAAKNFNLSNQIKINAKLNGAAYYGAVLYKLESHPEIKKETIEFFLKNIKENLDLFNSKYLVLIGLTENDPLVELFYELLSDFQKSNAYVLKEGYFDLILRNYFFRPKYFLNKEDENIFLNEEKIAPYLLFRP